MAEYVVITDTSCLILLDNIHALDLLPLIYRQILTTPEIAAEFKITGMDRRGCSERHEPGINL